jgi:hypothetical protein
MQLLQPLAVEHVGLTARDVFRLTGIDKQHFEAPLHQKLVERNPVNARGFHRHRLDLALLQPVGQSAEISGKGPEAAHILPFGIAARGDSGPVLFRSDVDACGIEIDPLELRGKRYFMLRYNADFTAPLGTSAGGAHGGFSFDNVD